MFSNCTVKERIKHNIGRHLSATNNDAIKNTITVEEFLDKNLLNEFQLDSERADTKPNYSEGGCRMSGMPQVRVDIVGRPMQLVGNHKHFLN